MATTTDEDGSASTPPGNDIFSRVVGRDRAKAVSGGALRAGDVHVLYVGPPSSGKSTMFQAIEDNLPDGAVIYRDGQRFTATRVQSILKHDPPILLIDEFDSLSQDAYDVLSNPLEHGRLTEEKHSEQYDIEVETQVFGACNSTAPIPGNIKRRFREVPFEPYSAEERVEVAERMLPDACEWIEVEKQAAELAMFVNEHQTNVDIRDIRDIAKLSSSMEEARMLVVGEDGDGVEYDPITPGEVKRAQTDVGRTKLQQMVEDEVAAVEEDVEDGAIEYDDVADEMDEHMREEVVREISRKKVD